MPYLNKPKEDFNTSIVRHDERFSDYQDPWQKFRLKYIGSAFHSKEIARKYAQNKGKAFYSKAYQSYFTTEAKIDRRAV